MPRTAISRTAARSRLAVAAGSALITAPAASRVIIDRSQPVNAFRSGDLVRVFLWILCTSDVRQCHDFMLWDVPRSKYGDLREG